MLKIHLLTGTAWTSTILVDGEEGDDLLQLIDDYYFNHGLPVPLYHFNEIDLDGDNRHYLPINGGEYYIEGIAYIDSF